MPVQVPGIRLLWKHLNKPVEEEESLVIKHVRKELASALDTHFLGLETWELKLFLTQDLK